MLKLWGRASSINVQKVLLCLRTLGLAYERVDAGLEFGVVDTPAYRAKNPNGLVPLLEDGDFQLWESNAIVRYLCATRAPSLARLEDPPARADEERWMDWQLSTLNPPMSVLFWGLVRKPGSRTEAEIADARAKADFAMGLLDARLATAPNVSGAVFGMADFAIAPYAHRWLNLPIERTDRLRLRAYYERLMAEKIGRDVLSPIG